MQLAGHIMDVGAAVAGATVVGVDVGAGVGTGVGGVGVEVTPVYTAATATQQT